VKIWLGAMNRRKRLTFWSANDDDDSLVRNVIAGKKTATAAVASEYHVAYGDFGDGGYEVDDIVEVYDPKRRLRCLIRITDVHPMKFGHIPEKVWAGEGFNSADEFRECHVRCMPQHDLHDEFEFMIVHFRFIEEIQPSEQSGAGND